MLFCRPFLWQRAMRQTGDDKQVRDRTITYHPELGHFEVSLSGLVNERFGIRHLRMLTPKMRKSASSLSAC